MLSCFLMWTARRPGLDQWPSHHFRFWYYPSTVLCPFYFHISIFPCIVTIVLYSHVQASYIYIYMYIHIFMCIYICIYMYVYIYICMYIFIFVYIYMHNMHIMPSLPIVKANCVFSPTVWSFSSLCEVESHHVIQWLYHHVYHLLLWAMAAMASSSLCQKNQVGLSITHWW